MLGNGLRRVRGGGRGSFVGELRRLRLGTRAQSGESAAVSDSGCGDSARTFPSVHQEHITSRTKGNDHNKRPELDAVAATPRGRRGAGAGAVESVGGGASATE
jgi:hypothetical protein